MQSVKLHILSREVYFTGLTLKPTTQSRKTKAPLIGAIIGVKLVQQLGKSLHEISDEITTWRKVLEVPYQEYLLGRPYEVAAMLPTSS